MAGRLRVTCESYSGRNQRFRDTVTGREMPRQELLGRIEAGEYPRYHIRVHGLH